MQTTGVCVDKLAYDVFGDGAVDAKTLGDSEQVGARGRLP